MIFSQSPSIHPWTGFKYILPWSYILVLQNIFSPQMSFKFNKEVCTVRFNKIYFVFMKNLSISHIIKHWWFGHYFHISFFYKAFPLRKVGSKQKLLMEASSCWLWDLGTTFKDITMKCYMARQNASLHLFNPLTFGKKWFYLHQNKVIVSNNIWQFSITMFS